MISTQDLINQTNQYRIEQGLAPLKVNAALQKAAEERAKDMAVTGNFSHSIATTTPGMQNGWGFMDKAGYRYVTAGENLATLFDDPTSTVQAWRNSPSHNKNLVNPAYSETGIAVVPATYKGKKTSFIVQFFGSPVGPTAATQPRTLPEQVRPTQTNPVQQQAQMLPDKPIPLPRLSLPMTPSPMPQSTPQMKRAVDNKISLVA